MNKDITIIYVIYKSGSILFKNLKLLKNFKKIIIDNDCKSILFNKINKIDPNANYEKLDTNIGMSKAANLAFQKIKTRIPKDKIVEDLKREFDIRSCIGINKYKTTLQDNNSDDFLQHLKEELMDAALYIQKIQSQNLNK